MITRSICKITEKYDEELLNNLTNHVSNPKIEEGKTLRNVVRLNPQIDSENTTYLSGKLYYQKVFSIKDFEIEDDGNITENDNIIRRTFIADFWIKRNPGLILFSNKNNAEAGSQILSNIIFNQENNIQQLKFRIEDIERDIQSGMWTYSFKNRAGNIQKGQLYGEDDVDQDPIFGLTRGAPRNFIGIKRMLNNELIKIIIYRSGSISFFCKLGDLATEMEIQDLIENFLPYGYLD